MARPIIAVSYVLATIVGIITLDALIFRNHFWERLIVDVGIVLAFAGFYLLFLQDP